MSISKKLILSSFAGGLILALLIGSIRWQQSKEFFMPAVLSGLIVFAISLSFSSAGVKATVKTAWYWMFFVVVILVLSGFLLSKVEKAWPAENKNSDFGKFIIDRDNWDTVDIIISSSPLKLITFVHKYRGQFKSLGNFNSELYWDLENFAYGDNIEFDIKNKKYIFTNAIWNIKNEDGKWTNFVEPNEIKFFPEDRVDGKRVFTVRIVTIKETELLIPGNPPAKQILRSGETLASRHFYY